MQTHLVRCRNSATFDSTYLTFTRQLQNAIYLETKMTTQSKTRYLRVLLHSMSTIACAAMLSFTAASAQTPTATLSGTVHDSTGAVIPHAEIELLNAASGDVRKLVSNDSGVFSFSALQSGNYDITVSAQGFAKYTQKGYHLDPGDQRALNEIQLGVGTTSDVVIVSSDANRIDTTTGETSALITAQDIQHLAVQGRDVTELFKILPGFAIANQGVGNTAYDPAQVSVNGAIGSYAANGAPLSGVSLKWDGANITDPGNYGAAIQNVNYDMVGEVKVQVANFTADQANGPVNVSAVTKSGGSQFHGDLYTYARTSQLNSADWLAKKLGYQKPPDRFVYPGIDIGGPVTIPGTNFNRKGRVTFFAGVEDYAQRNNYAYGSASSAIVHALVPTAAMRKGDFSQTALQQYLGPNYGSGSYGNITNVPTVNKYGTAVTNGNIASAIDPGGAALLSLLPLPNTASTGTYNYITQNLINNNLWQALGRVDVGFSDKYKLFVRYAIERGGNGVPQVPYYSPSSSMGAVNTPGGGLLNTIDSQSAAANLTMILSPTTTNEVFGSFAYLNSGFAAKNNAALQKSTYNYPYAGAYSSNGSTAVPQLQDYGNDGLPLLLLPDLTYGPIFAKKFLPDVGDNFTKVIKTHTLKAGVYVEQVTNNQRVPFGTTNGALSSYYIGSTITDVDGSTYTSSGNYLANALQGIFGSYSQQNILPNINLYFWNVDGFATDSWKINRRLTVNFGVRFEHLSPWNDKHGVGVATFDPTTLNQTASATRPLPGFRWHAIDPSVPTTGINAKPVFVEPRAGFAWDVRGNGHMVVRGGYGQYRYHDSWNDASNALSSSTGLRSTSLYGNGGVTLAGISKQNLAQNSGGLNTTAYGLRPGDNEAALTTTYSLAMDAVLPYKTQLEVSYVGNNSNYLLNTGSNQTVNLSNVNALPYGALFAPVGGVRPTPYAVGQLDAGTLNSHRPYGTNPYSPATGTYVTSPYGSVNNYGTIGVPTHNAFSNYNGIQLALSRQSGPLRYGVNYTFSKALSILGAVGAGNPVDATNLYSNYGIAPFDRTQIFNANYSYEVGTPVHNKLVGGFANGWEVSGITQLQSGQDLQVSTGPPNFSPTVRLSDAQYTGGLTATTNPSNTSLLGTPDITLMPTLRCNPKSGVGNGQYINGTCFSLGAQTSSGPIVNGPSFYPYLHGPMYFQSDLSAQKAFHITDSRQLQFRLSAFNFLNHPLRSFNYARSNEYSGLLLSGVTPGSAIADPTSGSSAPGSQFGTATLKQGRRVLEVSAKFVF